MSLLLALMLAAGASQAAPAGSGGPIATAPSARSQAPPVATGLQERACAAPSPFCRHIDSFGMVVSPTQALTVQVNKDLDYATGDSLTLMLGETATFKVSGASLALVSAGRAADLPLSSMMELALGGNPAAGAAVLEPVRDQIRLSLIQAPGRPDIFLFVENGVADKTLSYQAHFVSVNSVETSAQVCSVFPGKYDVEKWAFAAPSLRLSGFTLSAPGPQVCQ